MSFLEELRDFLRHPTPFLPAVVDHGRHRRRFLTALEQREAGGMDPAWLRRQYDELGRDLTRFVEALSAELLGEGIPPADVPALVDAGIAQALELEARAATLTRTLILERAVERVQGWLAGNVSLHANRLEISRYAHEIQAVRQHDDNVTITAIGRVVLDLAGREAVKWLLHVETALSTGTYDPWHVDRGTLRELARRDAVPARALESPDAPALNLDALDRLAEFGLVSFEYRNGGDDWWRVLPGARSMLRGVADDTESPMPILIQALLEDDVHSRLPAPQDAPATTATIRQARLVVHELRNTVIPIQVALDAIERAARAAGISDRIAGPRRRMDTGLERLLSFASELDTLTHAAGEAPDPFDTGSAVRDAAGIIRAELGHEPTLALPEGLPPLLGIRSRFVLALVNVLRNAYQAAPAAAPDVALLVEHAGDRVRLTVDDNGPGVAPEQREAIFRDGYSTRAGGTGHGLALARTTIEQDMSGTLSCEDGSSLGGARFVMTVPVYDRRTP